MSKNDLEGKWAQVKGEVQKQWGKLTNDDLDVIAGNREKLIGKLQDKHDMTREQAEAEVSKFDLPQ